MSPMKTTLYDLLLCMLSHKRIMKVNIKQSFYFPCLVFFIDFVDVIVAKLKQVWVFFHSFCYIKGEKNESCVF